MAIDDLSAFRDEAVRKYPLLRNATAELAHGFVHDVVSFQTPTARYALKLYRPGVRTPTDVEWEVALSLHLFTHGAPVAEIVSSPDGYVALFECDGVERPAVLAKWLPGRKPSASHDTYKLLGTAAALIHTAADTFDSPLYRSQLALPAIVDTPLVLMRAALDRCNCLEQVEKIASGAKKFVNGSDLDWGVCHNDLTLDNVHVDRRSLAVFDLDSARSGWRAMEPSGVYAAWGCTTTGFWQAWCEGYRGIRTWSRNDEDAVAWFALIAEFENVAWKLGLTPTSVGVLLAESELASTVDQWTARYQLLTETGLG